ncbi:OmpL47-type beta-barrel domain-containing protein [Bacteroidota bacterium]
MHRYITLILFTFLLTNFTFCQEIVEKDSYTYYDTSGNFYVMKSQPIYLWLGFSPDSTEQMHLLQSDSSVNFTNPMFFDQEGLNIIRSPWAVDTQTHTRVYPLEVIQFEIYVDGTAPKTSLKYGNVSPVKVGKNIYYGNDLVFKLISTDKNSGIYNTYFSIDSKDYKIYEEPIICNTEKEYLIQYYTIDNVGNREQLGKYRFIVDKTSPETMLSIDGDLHENIVSQRSKIILKSTDNSSGVKKLLVKIDNGPLTVYKGPLNASFLKQGEHTLVYYAADHVGNKEEEKIYTFFVDKTPPILVEEVLGNSFMNDNKEYSSGRSKLKLTAVDNKAGVKAIYYSLNKGEYQKYEKPFYLSVISGSLNINSYAVDNVNNQSTASSKTSSRNVTYIDLTGPEISYEFVGAKFKVLDSIYISKNTAIKLIANDKESGYKSMDYNIDESSIKTYENPFKIEQEGSHKIGATAFDNVDNSNHYEFDIIIDNTGPQIFSRFSILPLDKKDLSGEIINVYSSQVALFLSVTDARVAIDKIYYQINNEPEKQYISYIGGFKQGLDYSIKVRTADKLGNETIDSIVFATDNTGPEIYTQFSAPVKSQKDIEGKKVNVYPAHVSLFLSVTNAHIPYEKIFYSINNGVEKAYSGVIEGFKPGSDISMKIRAIDQLGNQTNKEIYFVIE